jgi:hypothetical protein
MILPPKENEDIKKIYTAWAEVADRLVTLLESYDSKKLDDNSGVDFFRTQLEFTLASRDVVGAFMGYAATKEREAEIGRSLEVTGDMQHESSERFAVLNEYFGRQSKANVTLIARSVFIVCAHKVMLDATGYTTYSAAMGQRPVHLLEALRDFNNKLSTNELQ